MRLLAIAFCFLLSCGAPVPEKEQAPAPGPAPNPKPQPGKTSFADVKAIMDRDGSCVDCHAGAAFVKTEAGLLASSAKARVQNGSMPPPYAEPLPSGDKAKFLNFFSE